MVDVAVPPAATVTGLKEKLSPKPDGEDEAEKRMFPEKPLLVTVIVVLIGIPKSVFNDCGLAEMAKSPLIVSGSQGLMATLLLASPLYDAWKP